MHVEEGYVGDVRGDGIDRGVFGFLRDPEGKPILIRNRICCFDLAKPAVRDWWADSVENLVDHAAVDGCSSMPLSRSSSTPPSRLASPRLGSDRYEKFTAGYRAESAIWRQWYPE